MILIQTREMAVGYGRHLLLSGISLTVGTGECILLCGANGSGKTTLLHTLAGDLAPASGSLTLAPGVRKRTVLIPTRIPKVTGFTLREFIRLSCYRESGWDGRLGPQAEAAISQSLERLGIAGLATRDIATLSDGEFQKGCIASALVRILASGDPLTEVPARRPAAGGLILLDEPTAFLDVEGRMQVLRLLHQLSDETGATILFSSHDLRESAANASRILGIAADGTLHDSAQTGSAQTRRAGEGTDTLPDSFRAVLSACFPSFR